MKKIYLSLVIAAIVSFSGLMFYLACNGKSESTMMSVSPAYREYIQAFTSGIVSTRSTVKIRLADDFADTVSFNTPITETFFKFEPPIKGKTYWSDSRTIEFRPDEKLPQNQRYTVSFYLSQLVSVPDSLKTMAFQFQTMSQEIAVEVDNHKAYSNVDLSKEHLKGTLRTSDIADDQQVEKILTASQGGRSLPVLWTHDQKTYLHTFQVDSVRRGNTSGEVKLEWDGSLIDSKTDGNLKIEIPALGDFKVLSTRNVTNTQQTILVQFSDPLKTGQILDGLFRIGKYNNIRYAVDDNLLYLYLPEIHDKKVRLRLNHP